MVELPDYYPIKVEPQMLHEIAPSLVQQISPGSVIIELGCAVATKTPAILNALLQR